MRRATIRGLTSSLLPRRPPRARPPRLGSAVAAALLLAAGAALLLRCASIVAPLGIDQSLWASAVRGMARGQLLYQDVWEQRPPGIYWIYLTGFRAFGWTPATVVWLDILAAAATTILLFAIARALAGLRTAALAAALYAALTMPSWLYRYGGFLERSVCETFIVVCVALSFLCAVWYRRRPSFVLGAGIGLFAGAAVVLKPNAGLYFPAVLAWLACYRDRAAAGSGVLPLRLLMAAAVGGVALPIAAVAWLWSLGTLAEAERAVIDFNRFYVAQGFALGSYAIDLSKAIWLRMKTDPLWLAGGVGAVVAVWDLARRRALPPLAGLAVLWGGAAFFVIVVNGARLFNSYFLQAFAPLALLTAWLLIDSARASVPRRIVAVATASLMLAVLLQRHYPAKVFGRAWDDFQALRGHVDVERYLDQYGGYGNERGYSARANRELADYVRERTTADDRIFLFGINGAGVYFAADRLTAHRFLRVNFFVPSEFPDPRFTLEAVTADLAASRPAYLIFERLHSRSEMATAVDALTSHPAVVRLLEGYAMETRIEDFTLYRRLAY